MKEAVLEYIKNNSGEVDSVDIVTHFGLRADITMKHVGELEEEKKITRKNLTFVRSAYFHNA